MGNLTIALVFVLVLNVLMFLTQATILDINPDSNVFWTNKGTLMENFDKTNGAGDPVLDTDKATSELPSGEGSVSPTTGNLFTDTFSSIKGWFARATGISYILGIVSAPYNIIKAMGLPNSFAYAIGTLWYGITFFLIIAFFWGRDQ